MFRPRLPAFRRTPTPSTPGTVPYHRAQARIWRRQAYLWALNALVVGGLLVTAPWWMRPAHAVLLFFAGTMWMRTRNMQRRQEATAWKIEGEATLTGMQEAGLLDNPLEVLEIMRDGPTPPGIKRDDWVTQHNELINELKNKLT